VKEVDSVFELCLEIPPK